MHDAAAGPGLFRSLLFAPGNHARRSEKAFTLGADAVVLDLEDACPAAEKVATRPLVVAALQRPRTCGGYVRVNPLSTEYGYGDLVAVVRAGVDGVVLPKVESGDEVRTAEWLIAQLEREAGLAAGSVDLVPIVETGQGLRAVDAIARAGARMRRIAFGAADFCLDMDLLWSIDESELLAARSALALASRAAGLEPPLDTVWVRLQDPSGFAASAARARGLGFQGKLCIHPDQVAPANAAFGPRPDQVAWALRVVAAFEAAEASGSASISVDGRFVDIPVVEQARRVVARQERIAAGRA